MKRDEFRALMIETTKNMSGGEKSTKSATNSVQNEIAAFLKASVEQVRVDKLNSWLNSKFASVLRSFYRIYAVYVGLSIQKT